MSNAKYDELQGIVDEIVTPELKEKDYENLKELFNEILADSILYGMSKDEAAFTNGVLSDLSKYQYRLAELFREQAKSE